jgi:hypothetical protein
VRTSNGPSIITLPTDESECGSGWCTAYYGRFDFKQVTNFAGKTHRILKGTTLNLQVRTQTESLDYVDNDLLWFSEDGGDSYYPSGGYEINMALFEEIPMTNIKRPVHIFIGDSNTCKSTLAALTGKEILETDYTGINDLPKIITEDIIVVGNKFNINIETDIIPRIFDLEKQSAEENRYIRPLLYGIFLNSSRIPNTLRTAIVNDIFSALPRQTESNFFKDEKNIFL